MHSNILVLDASQRSSLAVVRSLGVKKLKIYVADETPTTLAGKSKYCYKSIVYPSPYYLPNKFIEYLNYAISKYKIDILIPITDITTELVLKNTQNITNVLITAPNYTAYESLTNKYKLFKYAEINGIPMPKTQFYKCAKELLNDSDNIKYPIILKPEKSIISLNDNYIKTQVSYIFNHEHLLCILNDKLYGGEVQILVQEVIAGEGQGIFLICNDGNVIQSFSHKRIRQKPPSGGVSVLSESIPVDSKMLEISEKIVRDSNWNGIVMVEFIVTENNEPYLIEVNGRFWGSLQLAIDSGVDFPYLLYCLFTGRQIITNYDYSKGVKLRWLLGDLDNLLINLKDSSLDMRKKITCLCNFFRNSPHTKYEVNRLSDFQPFIEELSLYIKNLYNRK